MDGAGVQRVGATPYAQEARALLEGLGAKARDLHELGAARKSAGAVAVCNDVLGKRRADPGHIGEEIGRSGVEVDSYGVHARLDRAIKLLFEESLVHVVLVLADSEVLGVDLDELGERVHEPASDADCAADRDVLVGHLLAGYLRGAVDAGSVFADGPDLAAFWENNLFHEVLRLAAGGAVADGDGFDPVLFDHLLDGHERLDFLALGRVGEDDGVVQQLAVLVEDGDLAAVAEARVDRHGAFLPDGRAQKQLAEVLSEHFDRLDIGLLLGFFQHAVGDRRVEKPLECIFAGRAYLGRKGGGGSSVFAAEGVVDIVGAALGIGVDPYAEEAFVLGPQHRQQVVGRNTLQRHREIEIAAVFVGFGIVFCGFGHARDDPAAAVDGAEFFAYGGGFAKALCDDVAGSGESVLDASYLVADEFGGAGGRVRGAYIPHRIGKRLKAELFGDGRPGPALGTVGEVDVFEFGGGDAFLDRTAKFVGERAGCLDGSDHGLLALFHLGEHVGPVLHFSYLGVVHPAGFFLAVAADEGDGVSILKHHDAVFDLPVLQGAVLRNEVYVVFFHQNFLNLRAMTPQNASPKIPPDIFELPALRLTKMTGTSATLKPFLTAVYFISIWKP